MLVDLMPSQMDVLLGIGLVERKDMEEMRIGKRERTFAIRARRKDRIRYLNLSNSVWMMMRRKLDFGSKLPVSISTSSIFASMCQLHSMIPQPLYERYLSPSPIQHSLKKGTRPWEYLRSTPLRHPCSSELLQITGFLRNCITVNFGENVTDVHG